MIIIFWLRAKIPMENNHLKFREKVGVGGSGVYYPKKKCFEMSEFFVSNFYIFGLFLSSCWGKVSIVVSGREKGVLCPQECYGL